MLLKPQIAFRFALLLAVGLLTAVPLAAQDTSDDVARSVASEASDLSPDRRSALGDSILALTGELADAWARLDVEDYLPRFSEDLVFYYEGTRVDHAEFEAAVREAMESLDASTFEILNPDVEILGPDAAVISFAFRELMTGPGDQITDLRGALTLVYERRDGRWLVVRAHESVPASPAAPAQSGVEIPRTRSLPGIEHPAFPYARPEEVGLSSEKLDRLGDEIVSWVAAGDLVGAEFLIVKDGRAVFHEAYGWSDREASEPVERNSIWSIKSMSKPFTAAAVLMLAEEGRLSLDDPVSRYIPGFAGDPRTTIRHLLSHTSGYRDADLGDPIWVVHTDLREWVEEWASRTPSGTLGAYEYTDFGFAAAGYIVEAVTGVSIGRFTEERIVQPLGLDASSTEMSDDPVWRDRLNPWYRWNDKAGAYHLRWTSEFPGWDFYPAAWGMFSTAMDYATWMALWMNQGEWRGVRLLSEETVEEALREHARRGLRGYGYGWFVWEEPTAGDLPAVFYHGGGDGTMAIALPGADAMAILLTHSRGIPNGSAMIAALGMLEIFDHPGPGLVWAEEGDVEIVDLIAAERSGYSGTYAVGEGFPAWVAHIREEDGVLQLRITRPGGRAAALWFHLAPVGGHRFIPGRYAGERLAAIHPDRVVEFTMERDRATAVQLFSGGDTVFVARRVDPDAIAAEVEARRSRVSASDILERALEAEGIEAARERFRALLRARPDSVHFNEVELTTLGYRLLRGQRRVDDAITVFELTVEAFPEEASPYHSLGDAYRQAGRLREALRQYERAVERGERQGHEDLYYFRAKLEWWRGEM